jgi:DNA-binding CsgD family transcriptional regulator
VADAKVAAALGISPRTVQTHKYQSLEALGLKTTAELIHYAVEHGLTIPPERG